MLDIDDRDDNNANFCDIDDHWSMKRNKIVNTVIVIFNVENNK